jgi:predicted DNA-binding transcriptional regulator AlpA
MSSKKAITPALPSIALPDPLYTTEQAACLLQLRPQTLRKWLMVGKGPQPTRVGGRSVRYRQSSIDRFLNDQSAVQPATANGR